MASSPFEPLRVRWPLQAVVALKAAYCKALTMTAERLAAALLEQQPTCPAALLDRGLELAAGGQAGKAFDAKVQVGRPPAAACPPTNSLHARIRSFEVVMLQSGPGSQAPGHGSSPERAVTRKPA